MLTRGEIDCGVVVVGGGGGCITSQPLASVPTDPLRHFYVLPV